MVAEGRLASGEIRMDMALWFYTTCAISGRGCRRGWRMRGRAVRRARRGRARGREAWGGEKVSGGRAGEEFGESRRRRRKVRKARACRGRGALRAIWRGRSNRDFFRQRREEPPWPRR